MESFNCIISGILAVSLLGVISICIFLIHKADSPQEYMKSIYMITAAIGILLSFASTVLIKQKLFLFINRLDAIIDASELNLNQLNMNKFAMHISKF